MKNSPIIQSYLAFRYYPTNNKTKQRIQDNKMVLEYEALSQRLERVEKQQTLDKSKVGISINNKPQILNQALISPIQMLVADKYFIQ